MASFYGMRKYPPRLYEFDKTLVQIRSINHSCHLANVQTVLEAVGDDVVGELRESTDGVIVQLKELEYTWSVSCVQHFLANQLAIESNHEMWSLIDCMPLQFSLYEFEMITRLNCDSFDMNDGFDVNHESFWLEMNVPLSEGPTLEKLEDILSICRNWSREKRVMIDLLGLLSIGKLYTQTKVLNFTKTKKYMKLSIVSNFHSWCIHALIM